MRWTQVEGTVKNDVTSDTLPPAPLLATNVCTTPARGSSACATSASDRTGARARPSCSASRLVSSESSLAASRAEARGAGQRADGFQLLRFFCF